MTVWARAQESEVAWWGDCVNTYQEESKQRDYALRMGLTAIERQGRWPVYDLGGRAVVDVGGGPISLLLKCEGRGHCCVIDPAPYPEWIRRRYEAAGIAYVRCPAEALEPTAIGYDEVWIYNVLQHVKDPREVVARAKMLAPVLRIFEWLHVEADETHPHTLLESELNMWIGQKGTSGFLPEFGATAYYGAFSRPV
jgi:2-polyprenyl-3-methyl-5-hydroxy-6-metoxy-1,4-benzoquinol methylase